MQTLSDLQRTGTPGPSQAPVEPGSPAEWYRYTTIMYAAAADEWGESRGPGHQELVRESYYVVKTTPKGVWLSRYRPAHPLPDKVSRAELSELSAKFVLHSSKKQWACSTPELALEAFKARKRRQAVILSAQLQSVQSALYLAEHSPQSATINRGWN